MAAVTEGPSIDEFVREENSSAGPEVAVIFAGVSLVLGIASRHLLRGTRVPYTVALLILGIALGAVAHGTNQKLGLLGEGIRLWSEINPGLLLAVFLPALLFESSFSMEIHQIKRCLVQMLLLAGPGVLISTFCLGTAMKLTFPYNWSWKTSLLLGGLLSATDPVAVVALLKELGASKKLSTIIEGESLMNDGTAIVVYQLFYEMVLGETFDAADVVKFLSKVSLGAVAVGLAFGIASVLWLGFIFNDTVIEITLTLAVSYIAYFTADKAADVSGVLTVMTLGMFYSAVARTAFKGDSQQSLHHFWEMVAYIANTLIFILSGVVIAESVLGSSISEKYQGVKWGYLFVLYVFIQVSRFIVVGTLFPLLRYFGYGLDWKEAAILIWSGLRGAVALSLSLSVKRASTKITTAYLNAETGSLFVFFTGGIVFLTLIVNGSTTQFVLHLLGMDKASPEKIRILDYTRFELMNKALEAFGELGDDEELGPAEWSTVKRYITCLDENDAEKIHPHIISESQRHLHNLNLKDIRVRLLNGVQAAYWGMLEEGRINQTSAILLMQSVDEALDVVSHEPLCDWKGLKANVHFPSYYKYLQFSRLPQKLVTYFTVERLESACYICAAFLRAHRIARRQLHDFIGESEIAAIVIQESEAEGEEAQKFLEDVRLSFPQVLRVVKTRQVTYAVLVHLSEYIQNLEKVGLLEAKEMNQLHDAVQTDLKKLLRNPPLVKMPKLGDILSMQPLLGALPTIIREPIEGSAKEMMKLRGVYLYREGSKPNGVWLISNGVVKWTSKSLRNRHSMHPTFSHGSTLGLYEALVGKPYLCDIVTDSVVHCFFIETEKILSVLRSNPSLEEFFWQESAIVLAKLLLPQTFEEISLQELRSLVAERSTVNIFLRGEVIDLSPNVVGFVLEGFINQDDKADLIRAPAVLLPFHEEKLLFSFGGQATSFCYHASSYQAETRSRIIFFDIGSTHTDGILQRSSASWISHSFELPGHQTREHGGLVSWPEHAFLSRKHLELPPEAAFQSKKYSERAMQVGIFGSMVNLRARRNRSFPWSYRSKSFHSMSFPRMPSKFKRQASARPLKSVRSEGETVMGSQRLDRSTKVDPAPALVSDSRKGKRTADESSEESGDDEVIVRIDSPSRLIFHQRPGKTSHPNP
ncbi:sodium/hydrogen exchanger 8 isoform X2 [Nymphaea colorata]|nr:sodium/hydrogen exchanger 8 isoform X2 [Nymphaea colorata]